MRIRRGILLPVTLGAVVVVAIAGALIVVLHPVGAAQPADAQIALTAKVQRGTLSRTITAMGSIAPAHEVSASFAVSGTVASVSVAVGQTVAAGATLGTLDTAALAAGVSTAENDLTAAKAQASAAQAGSAAQLATAESALADAENTLTGAQASLADATLTAPIAGTVVAVGATVGSHVSAGNPAQTVATSGTGSSSSGFVTIADASQLTMTAQIAEADIASVSTGQQAAVTFPAVPQLSVPAAVTAIAPTATSAGSTVSYAVTVALTTTPAGIRLGQTAQLDITTASAKGTVLSVPNAAITTASDGSKTVDVVDAHGSTSTVNVTTGVVGDTGTEIVSGLRAGATVVIGHASADQSATQGTRQSRFGGTGPGAGFGGRTGGGDRGTAG